MVRLPSKSFGLLLAFLAALGSCGKEPATGGNAPAASIGLFTTLPVYWAESADLAEMLAPDGEMPWPRRAIEQRGHHLVPLDTLAEDGQLDRIHALLLAQPRPLSPAENVALDNWVRSGGQALVFADPALTAESRFPLGDRRRPQDTVLLSPTLARWGLVLEFAEDQAVGEAVVMDRVAGDLPVNVPGRWRILDASEDGARAVADCRIEVGGVVARCLIGRGAVTLIADAALFEDADEDALAQRQAALVRLVDSLAGAAAGTARVKAGKAVPGPGGGPTSRPVKEDEGV